MNNPIIVALDTPDADQAKKLIDKTSKYVGCFKVGKELFTSQGPKIVEYIQNNGSQVFLDLKFHDIPNTVAKAVKSASSLGVFMCNVHALGGRTMMEEAKKSLSQIEHPPKLIGVTILTSHSGEDLDEVGVSGDVQDAVRRLALLAKSSGLDGVVASPKEIQLIREVCGKDFLIVTPGVRPEWASKDDQKRVLTPREAVNLGANYIVVGRPITASDSPSDAAQRILDEIQD